MKNYYLYKTATNEIKESKTPIIEDAHDILVASTALTNAILSHRTHVKCNCEPMINKLNLELYQASYPVTSA